MVTIQLRNRRFYDEAIKSFRYGLLTDSDVIRLCRYADKENEGGIGSMILSLIGLIGGIAIAYRTPRGKEVFESLISIVKKIKDSPKKVKALFSKLKELAKLGVPGKTVKKIKEIALRLWEKLKEKMAQAKEFAKGAAEKVKNKVSEAGASVKGKMSSVGEKVKSGINRIKASSKGKSIIKSLKKLRSLAKSAKIDERFADVYKLISNSIIAMRQSLKPKRIGQAKESANDAKRFIWKLYWGVSKASKAIKKEGDKNALKLVAKAYELANSITIDIDKYMKSMTTDSVSCRDSRLKRSVKRPGNATSWEIKMVLGFPENASIDMKRYVGRVDPYGNVAVVDLMNPKKQPVMLSGMELDRIAMTGKREMYGPLPGGLGGMSKSSEKEENKNQSTLGRVLGKVGGIVNTAGDVATTIRTIKNGSHMTVMAAKEIGNMAGELGSLAKSIVGTIKRAIK